MNRFRTLFPIVEFILSLISGSIGAWQRNRILSRELFFGDGWHSTARFHVWPWPLKFAIITNIPAMVPSLFLSWPIEVLGNEMAAKFLYFVTVLLGVATFLSGVASWYWIGSRFDRQWILKDRTPWIALSIFTLVALAGSLLDLGTSGYLLFGAVLWILWAVVVSRISRGEAWLRRSSKA